jgi:uncharacterized membrane protein YeaQ/YmgE (transglycosylase-associated protein family)
MSFFQYLNVGLIYISMGLACALYFTFVLRRPLLGRLWGAIIVGVIGSFLGGVVDQLFAGLIARLTDFQSVNLVAAFLGAMLLIWTLSKVSSSK